jgi:hypothetical protein
MRTINAFRAMLCVVSTTIAPPLCFGQGAMDQQDSAWANAPDVRVQVNKHFDDNGNLVAYDSSYSVVYRKPFFEPLPDSLFDRSGSGIRKGSLYDWPPGIQHPDRLQYQDVIRKRIAWMLQQMDLVRTPSLESLRRKHQRRSPDPTL